MDESGPQVGPAYLLSQLGHHAAAAFAERVRPLGLGVHQVGILRLVATSAAPMTQAALGELLGVLPSRLVGWLDELAAMGAIERRTNPADRRSNHLHATADGERLFAAVEAVSAALDEELLAGLSASDRGVLERLLREVARGRGLLPGSHPAYGEGGGG